MPPGPFGSMSLVPTSKTPHPHAQARARLDVRTMASNNAAHKVDVSEVLRLEKRRINARSSLLNILNLFFVSVILVIQNRARAASALAQGYNGNAGFEAAYITRSCDTQCLKGIHRRTLAERGHWKSRKEFRRALRAAVGGEAGVDEPARMCRRDGVPGICRQGSG